MLGPDGKPLPVVIDDNIGRFVQGGKYEQPFTVGNYVIVNEILRNISQKHISFRKTEDPMTAIDRPVLVNGSLETT